MVQHVKFERKKVKVRRFLFCSFYKGVSAVGKQGTERAPPVRDDTSTGCLDRCAGATIGSAGVDLATTVDVTLTTSEVQLIDSDQQGPLGHGLSALLIGRSSVSWKGIFIVPGLIDADYCGTIKIMVYMLTPPLTIPAQSKITQLVPFRTCVPKAQLVIRGQGGFGSTGVPNMLLVIDIARGKPEEKVTIKHQNGQSWRCRC
ncbi:deoxyuridine 5'-triphosphate nucleotidohydrolase-like [Egretta garzetta]|uniref:deoxyuridine 5'-triphosphate nucleotidohydrolase-like n=1 Tax=Egretta garzetta TaxID=188379 RepID=UPI00163BF902|nr:deoxyuridine 5'-triphosphate nucleotidohydrolase-like [Egretta garzetta]